MSEVSKKKEIIDEIGGLNTEVNRLRGLETTLKNDIQELEVKKAEELIAYSKKEEEGTLRLIRLGAEIEIREKKSLELDEINEKKLVAMSSRLEDVEKREATVSEHERKAVNSLLKSEDVVNSLNLQKINQDTHEKQLGIRENALLEQEKSLGIREQSLETALSDAKGEKIIAEKMQTACEERLNELDDREISINAKEISLDKREVELKVKEEEARVLYTSSDTLKTEYSRKLASLDEREKTVSSTENDLAKRIIACGQKEADVILRERDCRVREKTLSLKEREKQLDD